MGAALNQDKLVADQYARIGRIYDLRLSQYALAIQNYQKALNIYQDAEIQDIFCSLQDGIPGTGRQSRKGRAP